MDQLADNSALQAGLEKLNAKDKQELQQFVVNESQKAQIQGGEPSSSHLIHTGYY